MEHDGGGTQMYSHVPAKSITITVASQVEEVAAIDTGHTQPQPMLRFEGDHHLTFPS
jgi:hypothetical protein